MSLPKWIALIFLPLFLIPSGCGDGQPAVQPALPESQPAASAFPKTENPSLPREPQEGDVPLPQIYRLDDIADDRFSYIDPSIACDYEIPAATDYSGSFQAAVYAAFCDLDDSFNIRFRYPLSEEGKRRFSDVLQQTVTCVLYDHPAVFWVAPGGYTLTWIAVQGEYVCVKVEFLYTESPASIASGQNCIQTKLDRIVSAAPADPYEALQYFHDVIILNTEYDSAFAKDRTPLPDNSHLFHITGFFLHGKAVCEGYAKAMKYLCDAVNIPCVVVGGEAFGISHAWNYVCLDSAWYLVDVTLDDQTELVYAAFLQGKTSYIGNLLVSAIYTEDQREYPVLQEYAYDRTVDLPLFSGHFAN